MTVVVSGFSKLIQILKFTSLRYLSYADKGTCVRLKFVCQVLPALDGMNLSPYLYMYYADKGTCIRLKFVCQVLPALEGMNLSPYLSFCGEFTGVRCFLVILGCTNNKVYNIFVNKRYQ